MLDGHLVEPVVDLEAVDAARIRVTRSSSGPIHARRPQLGAQNRPPSVRVAPMWARPSSVMMRPRGRALDEAELQQVGLIDVLDRVLLLSEGDGKSRQPDRAAAELVRDRLEQLTVDALETLAVDLEQLEGLAGDLVRDHTCMAHLCHVAHAPEDSVRDAWRAPRAQRDLVGRIVLDLDIEDSCRASHDRPELVRAS